MNKLASAILLATLASTAAAKDKVIPLSDSAAAGLNGKTIAIVRHPRPDFAAFTAGKVMFGLVGGAAMISAGNDIISSNNVEDPAAIVERELAPVLISKFGMQRKDAPAYAITETKAPKIAALEHGVDYVLDIRSGVWQFVYYPTDWNNYWMMYQVQVQLIDVASGAQVANLACTTGNRGDKHPPSHDDIVANGAQLLKDSTQGFGWTCMKLLAKEEFHLADTDTPEIPAQFVDTLGKFAVAHHGATPAPVAATAAAPAAPTAAPAPASDAAAPATQAAPAQAAAESGASEQAAAPAAN